LHINLQEEKRIYKMKKTVLAILMVLAIGTTNAQILNPVQWVYSAKKIDDKTYEIHLTALIDSKWHIYAQDCGEGPVPTKFTFTANPLLSLMGKVKEVGKLQQAFDNNFNSLLKYYETQVDFVQKIKVRSAAATVLKGKVSFMICNDRQCLPPRDVPFSINVGGK
jgi:hypothetical protein